MGDVGKKAHCADQCEGADVGCWERLVQPQGCGEERTAFGYDIIDKDDSVRAW